MTNFSFSALVSVLGLLLCCVERVGASVPPILKLTTEPPIEQVIPAEKPVLLRLQATDDRGQPVQNAKIRLQIFAPSKTPWFSTDFPVVEGTQLLDIEAISPTGKLQLQQVLPIRGNYQLIVNVTPLENQRFSPTKQTFTISVNENWVKYRNFAILAVILGAAGFAGGLVIGKNQQPQTGEIAPQGVRLLLSGATLVAIAALLVVNISAEFAESHTHDHHHDKPLNNNYQIKGSAELTKSHTHNHHHEHNHKAEATNSQSTALDALSIEWLGDIDATVGQVSPMGLQLIDKQTGQPVKDVIFRVKAIQTEHDETVFIYQGVPDSTGKLTWKQQFFDGATHNIEMEVLPAINATRQFSPVRLSKNIEVQGIAPPMFGRLISLGYFTGIFAGGLLIGLLTRRSSKLNG